MQKLKKTAEAVKRASQARFCMESAQGYLEAAEHHLNLCGWRRAGTGVNRANERVKSWLSKLDTEILRAAAADDQVRKA